MKVGYAFNSENESFVARATGKELRIRFKDSIEVCAAIKGRKAKEAADYLQAALDNKAYIPFKKTKSQHGHTKGMKPFGRRPVKTLEGVLGVLKSAIANAEFKGLDLDNCVVISSAAQRGFKIRRMKPRGRHAVYNRHLTTIQIVLEELSK